MGDKDPLSTVIPCGEFQKAAFYRGSYICPWSKETKKSPSDVFKMIYDKHMATNVPFLNHENTSRTLSNVPIDNSKITGDASSVTWVTILWLCMQYLERGL